MVERLFVNGSKTSEGAMSFAEKARERDGKDPAAYVYSISMSLLLQVSICPSFLCRLEALPTRRGILKHRFN